jgi:hypothetical protein
MNRLMLWSITILLATSCDRSEKADELARRCERAVAKVALKAMHDEWSATLGKPTRGEQAIIDGVRKAAVASCRAEGLTPAQAACLDDIHDVEGLFQAADCPAIAAKMPSWFQRPSPEIRREAAEVTRAMTAGTAE